MNTDILLWVVVFISSIYILVVSSASYLWVKHKPIEKINSFVSPVPISVIVAARNEEDSILSCLSSILNQNYPLDLFEIIVVNDNSTDSTSRIIEKCMSENSENLKLIHLPCDARTKSYKKLAIQTAIKQAKGELIVTTDADCVMGPEWLNSIACFYKQHGHKMIVGPVFIGPVDSLSGKLQNLEFSALIGMGGAFLLAGMPLMCNGANLIYEKKSFNEIQGFKSIDNKASGDDMLLMLKFKKYFGSKEIGFIKNYDAVVYTKPIEKLKIFFQQRKRWASKSRDYHDVAVVFLAGIVFSASFSLCFCLIMSFISNKFALLFVFLFGVKCLIDLIFLFCLSSFFKNRKWLWLAIPGQLLNIIYVPVIAIASQFGSYNWKGRKLS
ncbi:MAG: glycosyltransferase [Bacteroidetes bacterium]|nr:glycosyltransferase [Bacteroidota bacterium]HET6243491.1 glycosyltransferase [Bacteroidia bacterium]